MKKRICFVGGVYLSYVLFFLLAKVLFLLFHLKEFPLRFGDALAVLAHGLPLDLSTAGYLTAVPLLVALVGTWFRGSFRQVLSVYFWLSSFLLAIIVCVDTALYGFWQFKLDATIFNYIDSPRQALASVSTGYILAGLASILLITFLLVRLLRLVPQPVADVRVSVLRRLGISCSLVVLGGVLFLFVRGGVGKSTMNIGAVYFSDQQYLNHAAVNPAFSLLASSLKREHYDRLYRYYKESERERLLASMGLNRGEQPTDTLLNCKRPDVLLILMEGFGASFVEPLGGEPGVTPCFNRLAAEGVLFTECYANSFRTDRGTVSTLSGYPAFPTISVMKLPEKSRCLPSLARSLGQAGYDTEFLYGGDINFTNMKSYLLSTGYQSVLGDTHFPLSVRKTHVWGVTDHIVFDSLYHRLLRPQSAPRFTTLLTLASHEPWEVPYHREGLNERTNAMAYTDHSLGVFIDSLQRTPLWQHLLVICIADHGIGYPSGITEADRQRSHIPMLWLGGALRSPRLVHRICNQSDLPVTLLRQLQLPVEAYPFSRDIMSNDFHSSAIHTFDEGFTYIDSTGLSAIDLKAGRLLKEEPSPSAQRIEIGKAYLQTAIDHFCSMR